MLCSGKMNNLVNTVHNRALRVVHIYYDSSFEGLLSKDNYSTIHQQNLKRLPMEMHKRKTNQNPDFENDIFRFHKSSYTPGNELFSNK